MWKSVGWAKLGPPFVDRRIDGLALHWILLDSVAEELAQALRGELTPSPHQELGKDCSTPHRRYATHQGSTQVIDAGEPTLRA